MCELQDLNARTSNTVRHTAGQVQMVKGPKKRNTVWSTALVSEVVSANSEMEDR